MSSGARNTARTDKKTTPELRLVDVARDHAPEASQVLLLERARRKARIKEAAAEASARLARLFEQDAEREREEMIWRTKLREAKERAQEEAEWQAALRAAKLQSELAEREEKARREEAEWQALIAAAKASSGVVRSDDAGGGRPLEIEGRHRKATRD